MIDKILRECQRECGSEWYVCPMRTECDKLSKIAEKLDISQLPYTWNLGELELVREHYRRY